MSIRNVVLVRSGLRMQGASVNAGRPPLRVKPRRTAKPKNENVMIWILFIGTMALSLWAAWRVKSVYARYNQGFVRSGFSGAQVAAEIARRPGPTWRRSSPRWPVSYGTGSRCCLGSGGIDQLMTGNIKN